MSQPAEAGRDSLLRPDVTAGRVSWGARPRRAVIVDERDGDLLLLPADGDRARERCSGLHPLPRRALDVGDVAGLVVLGEDLLHAVLRRLLIEVLRCPSGEEECGDQHDRGDEEQRAAADEHQRPGGLVRLPGRHSAELVAAPVLVLSVLVLGVLVLGVRVLAGGLLAVLSGCPVLTRPVLTRSPVLTGSVLLGAILTAGPVGLTGRLSVLPRLSAGMTDLSRLGLRRGRLGRLARRPTRLLVRVLLVGILLVRILLRLTITRVL